MAKTYVERVERKRIRCMEAGPEGKTGMLETRVVVDGVQGVYVGLNGGRPPSTGAS